jgi:hypothetical protein
MNPQERYIRYLDRCEAIYVRPASFGLWLSIEPWLIAHGRVAVLEHLRGTELWEREHELQEA